MSCMTQYLVNEEKSAEFTEYLHYMTYKIIADVDIICFLCYNLITI